MSRTESERQDQNEEVARIATSIGTKNYFLSQQ